MEAASRELSGLLEVEPSGTGMHAVGWLPAGTDEEAASRRAAAKGVEAPPLAPHRIETGVRPGLLLGFGAFDARKIEAGVRDLAQALS